MVDSGPPHRARCRRNFLLFAPWADQGLGIQARACCTWLRSIGVPSITVFACASSKNIGVADQAEWNPLPGVTVVKSEHRRDTVPAVEVLTVAAQSKASDAILLELCCEHMQLLADKLGAVGVRVWGVPNIELVRRREVLGLNRLSGGTLCSNEWSEAVLRRLGVTNTRAFPFALPPGPRRATPVKPQERLEFLLVGGLNSVRRKQANRVIMAFAAAAVTNVRLTVLSQGNVDPAPDPPRRTAGAQIRVLRHHLTRAQVWGHYARSHVVLMTSRAEGIGIGVYEALQAGCAVLSLATPIARELILPELNGWFVPCSREHTSVVVMRLVGNPQPVVPTFGFVPAALQKTVENIANGPRREVARRQRGARRAYQLLYSAPRMKHTYIKALS
jgi:glycosyltransferase involved in cell wall biosynthesis